MPVVVAPRGGRQASRAARRAAGPRTSRPRRFGSRVGRVRDSVTEAHRSGGRHINDQDVLRHAGRIAALRDAGLLDSAPEEAFDRVTRLATKLLDAPVGLVSLVDADRQFFKSCVGLPEPWAQRRETPLSHSFCRHLVESGEPLIIDDAREHPLVATNLAIPDLDVVAYAGMPLTTHEGLVLGALCVIDDRPRDWRQEEIDLLRDLAASVVAEIELRRVAARAEARAAEAESERRERLDMLERMTDAFFALDQRRRFTYLNAAAEQAFEIVADTAVGRPIWDVVAEAAGSQLQRELDRALREQQPTHFRTFYAPHARWLEVHAYPSPDGLSVSMRDTTEHTRAAQALAAQYAITNILDESEGLMESGPELVKALCTQLGWQLGNLWMVSPDQVSIQCVGSWQSPGVRAQRFLDATWQSVFGCGEGLPGQVWQSGTAVWIRDVCHDANFPRSPHAAADGLHGAAAFPVTLQDRVLGVIELFAVEPRPEEQALLTIMDAIGAQIGQFIERKLAEGRLREREARTRAILESALDAVITIDQDSTILEFNPAAEALFGVPRDRAVGTSMAELIVPPASRERHRAGIARYLRTGESNILGKRLELPAQRADGTQFLAELTVSSVDVAGARVFTGFVRDITERKRDEDALRFLAAAGEAISVSLDHRQIVAALVELAIPRFADWCAAYLKEDGTVRRVAVSGVLPGDGHGEAAFPDLDDLLGIREAIAGGRLVSMPEPGGAPQDGERRLEAYGIHSAICVPIGSGPDALGALCFASTRPTRVYDRAYLDLAQDVSRRLAVAVQQARLYEERTRFARTLQQSLLPPTPPSILGLEVAARYLPGAGGDVGGDFYDVFEADEGEWVLVMGDVCGKGTDAAALAVLARHTVRAAAVGEIRPSGVLGTLHEVILREQTERFCTAVYARLESGADGPLRVTLARAGHPSPVVLRADGSVEEPNAGGRPLGIFTDPALDDVAFELNAGDTLVLYTDGLTERGTDEDRDEALMRVLSANAGARPEELAARIEAEMLPADPARPRDDVALLILRVPEPLSTVRLQLAPDPASVRIARAAIDELADELGRDLSETVTLLVSELVTNSIRHARLHPDARVGLTVAVYPDVVRVDVSDHGQGFEREVGRPRADAESGWGLYLVARIADRWGVRRHEKTHVWFQLRREPARAGDRVAGGGPR